MSKDRKNIPFAFCRIGRAAEFLGVEVEDLLSLAIQRKISLCVYLYDYPARLILEGKKENINAWRQSLPESDSNPSWSQRVNDYADFSFDHDSHLDLFNIPEGGDEFFIGFPGYATGLWQLTKGFSDILYNGQAEYFCYHITPAINAQDIPISSLFPRIPSEERINIDTKYSNDDYMICEAEEPDAVKKDDLWITAHEVQRLLLHDGDLHNLPRISNTNENSLRKSKNRVHKNTERFATSREALLKAAIYLLSKYPDECRGSRKEISPEKWADCVLNHTGEVPPLVITSRDVIIDKFREAVNGKLS